MESCRIDSIPTQETWARGRAHHFRDRIHAHYVLKMIVFGLFGKI